jgi:hypothetical protein
MSFKFNPLTGQLDLVDIAVNGGGSYTFQKNYVDVDAAFLIDKKVTLQTTPIGNSEIIFCNGLAIKDDCYNIISNELTFDTLLDLRVGDELDIRFVS